MAQVYLNDRLLDAADAHIGIGDGGFLYGAGLFETMRVTRGRVFCLRDHLDRLFFSAGKLGFTLPWSHAELGRAIDQVIQANDLQEARLRLTTSVGTAAAAPNPARPTLLITAAPWTPYPEELYRDGALVTLCSFRQNTADPLTGHKTTNYFSRMLALQQARAAGGTEALWFTTAGYLAEGCISNVFLVQGGRLRTPPIETPVLAGVARKTVCALAARQGLDLEERDLTIDDLLAAEEVFLTNVLMTVLPVTRVEKHRVGDGRVGPVCRRLKEAYDEELQAVCGAARETT